MFLQQDRLASWVMNSAAWIQAVAKTNLGTVIRGVTPFIAIMLLSVIILVLIPSIVLYIPLELN